MPFQKEYFGLEDEDLIGAFNNPDAVIVILRDMRTNKVVGFTYAEPVQQVYKDNFYSERERLHKTAYIQNTALEPAYTGHGLVKNLAVRLENELIAKGYKFIERDALVTNGYAAKIQKKYSERIVHTSPHPSKWGQQMFFRIKLIPSPQGASNE